MANMIPISGSVKKLKIAIYGSAADANPEINKVAAMLGKIIADHGHTLITGACPGIPYEAAKAAYEHNGQVIGFSPAQNLKEHQERFSDPTDCFTEMRYIPDSFEYRDVDAACFRYRNISSAMQCDAAIIISGRYGTLDEFIIAYELGKNIGVLKNTGGTADSIDLNVIETISRKIQKSTGARVEICDNIDTLLQSLQIIP